MRVIAGEDEIVRAWIGQKIGFPYQEGTTLGVLSAENRLVGAVLFTNPTSYSVDVSAAGRVFDRRVWQAVGDMGFGYLGCVRLQAITRRGNRKVRSILPRLKWKFEGVMRRYYGDEDGLMFSMLREEAIALGYYKEPAHG